MQNGFVESFNGRLRDECLNEHLFTSYNHARELIEAWRIGLQSEPTSYEPRRAHTTRVRNPVQAGPQHERS
jgi:putative transposase